jgi:hypothetical protein
MCENAEKTALALFEALTPTISTLLNEFGQSGTVLGGTILTIISDITTDLQNWKPGTTSQNIIAALGDLSANVQDLPIPATAKLLLGTVLAGIEAIVTVLSANSPAPTGQTQAQFAAHEAAAGLQKVSALVPGFKYRRGLFAHSPQAQYNEQWNKSCDTSGFPQLKVA